MIRGHALKCGERSGIRTHGLWLRRPTLYPAELPAHEWFEDCKVISIFTMSQAFSKVLCKGEVSELRHVKNFVEFTVC